MTVLTLSRHLEPGSNELCCPNHQKRWFIKHLPVEEEDVKVPDSMIELVANALLGIYKDGKKACQQTVPGLSR